MISLTTLARRALLLGVVGATLITIVHGGDALAAEARHEAWNWSGALAAGRTLELNGVNGAIVAEPGSGDKVVVTADKVGKKHDPAVVKIEVKQDSNGITICAVYPGQSSPCRPLGLSFQDRADDVEVNWHVLVPSGVKFAVHNVNGSVQVHGLHGAVDAKTVNGACDIQTDASGSVSTVNGAVHASLGRLAATDAMSFRTVNGSITLELPDNTNAEVSSSTVNGSIETDFPITISGKWGPKHASGTIGKGGARLDLSTVNGAIHVRKSAAI